jgi:5-(carboxyamino)imidazole ribonucleotide synthase
MRVGVIGGGQLGRMLAWAGLPLGLDFIFLDPSPDAPAAALGPLIVAPFEDRNAVFQLAGSVDVVTYEFENLAAPLLREVAAARAVLPPPLALEVSQDRLLEKQLFQKLGIPTTRFVPIASREDLEPALALTGLPAMLKTRRFGYDGRGQAVIGDTALLDAAFQRFMGAPGGLLLENRVPFERELSLVACRGRGGEIRFYPLAENVHQQGILRSSRVPADVDAEVARAAMGYAKSLLDYLEYVGVLAIEFFLENGKLIANEMAPRVHNSGHWSIEAAETSQFENHLRAITGLPLGQTRLRGEALLVNAVGRLPEVHSLLELPGVHFHDYRKSPRPARKVGHATVLAASVPELEKIMPKLLVQMPFETAS